MDKQRFKLLLAAGLLIASILACGGGSGVEVSEPASQDDADTSQAEEAAAPEPTATKPVGTSRSNPAPTGSAVLTDDMEFVVLGFTRPATDIVMSANQFNTEPEEGQEYVFVELQVTCKKSTDEQCNLLALNFSLLGSAGVQRDQEIFLAGVDGLLEGGDFYGEASLSGNLAFIVGTDETDLLIVYEPFFGDTFYLAIE